MSGLYNAVLGYSLDLSGLVNCLTGKVPSPAAVESQEKPSDDSEKQDAAKRQQEAALAAVCKPF